MCQDQAVVSKNLEKVFSVSLVNLQFQTFGMLWEGILLHFTVRQRQKLQVQE